MKNLFACSLALLSSVFLWTGIGRGSPTISTLYVGTSAGHEGFSVFQALPTPRSLLTIDANGATKLRLELPPLLAGLPLQVIELYGQFDSSSHSVSVTGSTAAATCMLAGPLETVCHIVFATGWAFDAGRGKSYVRTRGFPSEEVAGREAVIDEFAAEHTASLKVRTRILL